MSPPEPAAREPEAAAGRLEKDFTADDLGGLRRAVLAGARRAGLSGDPLDDFVIAVHELATNAVRHGGGQGRLALRRDGDTLVCDVSDDGPGFAGGVPAAANPPSAQTDGGRGLWLARQLTDTLLITDGPAGATVSVTVCLPARKTHQARETVSTAETGAAAMDTVQTEKTRAEAPPAPHGRHDS
jgi:anti-sigma regulatory factor (Ser/Thr protein kinase)